MKLVRATLLFQFVIWFVTSIGCTAQPLYPPATWPTAPTYSNAGQAVFWISGNTLPGQSALVTGAFTTVGKTVYLLPLAGVSSANVASLLSTSTFTVPASLQSTAGLSFQLPPDFPAGPFAYALVDTFYTSPALYGNLPTIYWAQGVPTTITAASAPLHQIIGGGVEAGQTLRVFGRDFPANAYVLLTPSSGTGTPVAATVQNPYALSVTIPSTFATGTYSLSVGASATVDATYGATVPVTVSAPSTLVAASATCTLVSGGTDNTTTLRNFLTAHVPGTGTVELINIAAAGSFTITGSITLSPYQYLVGTGTATIINGVNSTPPASWISGSNHFGLINLSVTGPTSTAKYPDGVVNTDSSNGGHVVLYGVSVTGTGGAANTTSDVALAGPDIQIVGTTITGGIGLNLVVSVANGVLISGDTILDTGWSACNEDQDLILENCTINGAGNVAGSAVSFGINPNTTAGIISQNMYTGNNTVANITGNNREALLSDGGYSPAYGGALSGATANTVVLANPPDWVAVNNTNPQNCIVAIIAGKGMGQYRTVQSASSSTITLTSPWAVQPDTTTSIVSLSEYQRHVIYYGNTISNAGPAIDFYTLQQDCEIANNTIINSAGIFLHNFIFEADSNIDVLNNQLAWDNTSQTNATGTVQAYQNFLEPQSSGKNNEQGLLFGVLMRGNVGHSGQPATPGGFIQFFDSGSFYSILAEGNSSPANQWESHTTPAFEAIYPGVLLKENKLVAHMNSFGPARNNSTADVGFEFTVGNQPMAVTSVGRWVIAGNTQAHGVEIMNPSTWSVLATGTVTTSGATSGQFAYSGTFTTPLVLAANSSYALASLETNGGDQWYDVNGTSFSPGPGMTADQAVTFTHFAGTENNTYVPVDLTFLQQMPLVSMVQTAGTTSTTSGQVGLKFTVGSLPMTVTELGRWVLSGNTQSHVVQLVNATTGSTVATATVVTSGATPNQFAYAPVSTPVTLPAGGVYYLESQESGTDSYLGSSTTLSPGAGATINSAALNGAGVGSPNTSYGPVNLLSTF